MSRIKSISQLSIIAVIFAAFATGCATTRISDDELSPEQRQLRQQAQAHNKTVGQGVAWGALLGAVAGAALAGSGNRGKGAAIGAAAGGAVGGIAGTYYADKQREAASEEAFLADLTDDARSYNQKTADLIATAEIVHQDSVEKLADLRGRYENGQIERQILDRQITIAKSDQKILEESLEVAQQQLEKHQEAAQMYAKDFPEEDTQRLEDEIDQIAMRISELERLSTALAENIEASDVG